MTARTHYRADIQKAHVELNKLPHGSVVLDKYGHAWQLARDFWYRAFSVDETAHASLTVAHLAPIRVIHIAEGSA